MSIEKDVWQSAYELKVRVLDNDISDTNELENSILEEVNKLYEKHKLTLTDKGYINPDVDEKIIYGFINKTKIYLENSLTEQLSAEVDIMDLSEIHEYLGNIIENDGEYSLA